MDIQQIGLLSNEELDAVAGGMMNNGQGQLLPDRSPGALPPRGNGGPPDAPFDNKWGAGLAIFGAAVAVLAGL